MLVPRLLAMAYSLVSTCVSTDAGGEAALLDLDLEVRDVKDSTIGHQ